MLDKESEVLDQERERVWRVSANNFGKGLTLNFDKLSTSQKKDKMDSC